MRTPPRNGREASEDSVAWHQFTVDAALDALGTSRDGLASEQAARLLAEHGPNQLPQEKRTRPLLRFLGQFNDVLIYVLLAAAVITAFLGEWVDSGVILAVVLINALIGFVQEGKAEAALEAIRRMLALEATVFRDGARRKIAASELVPGDVVLLESGDRVPADLRIVAERGVRIDEATLTGESEPVEKQIEPAALEALLADRSSMVYSGTTVTSGRLTGVVVATGTRTEIGRIGEMVSRVETLTTPLLRSIDRFGKGLALAVLALAAVLFAFGALIRGFALADMLLLVVGLAVAAVPEGLPAIMTVTLALGVQRMARRNAIVRRLAAVETLGSVTAICSDKTGTLTKNEMTANEVVLQGATFEVTGAGYAPLGHFLAAGQAIEPQRDPALRELLRAGLLCSDAELRQDARQQWFVVGDPTEGAVIVLGSKGGLDRQMEKAAYSRLDVIPFESDHRFMASLHRGPNSRGLVFLKGAPEVVLARCHFERSGAGQRRLDSKYWEAQTEGLAKKGKRVLAIAAKETDSGHLEFDEVKGGMVLLGLIGMIDPPRPEAMDAVTACREAGISVKMITGDHALTAGAIAGQLGIGDGTTVLTGRELEAMDDVALQRAAQDHDVFARTAPEHKLRLVQALQAGGEVVAMTGDGVNDTPALKCADVGVAMGVRGSEAAKDASEVVLADDNFASIAEAVEEGRTIYDNLKKAILFILPTNASQALIILATVAFGFALLPVTPVQILWINMVTAVTLALALAFEPPEPGIMRRPPRDPNEPILSGYLAWRIAFVSLTIAALALLLFFRQLDAGLSIEAARTVAINVIVAGQLFYLFNSRFLVQSSLSLKGFVSNRAALIAGALLVLFQLLLTYGPVLQRAFGTVGLHAQDWLPVIGVGLAVFFLVEFEKAMLRRYRRRKSRAPVSGQLGHTIRQKS